MRLGLFGGAFNPVHIGHVNLAQSYIKSLSLDKLLVIPTSNPPHRSTDSFIPAQHRLAMLSLAFEDIEKAEISDIEFKRNAKSYTSDTIDELKKIYANSEIFLIIGSDQFLSFDKWYRYDKLLKEVTLCTAPREKNTGSLIKNYAENHLSACNYFIADFEPVVISSSEIRQKLKNGEDVSTVLPKKVYNYIIEKELYVE